jgi:sporulation protein YlmC with PRC-barrel domain
MIKKNIITSDEILGKEAIDPHGSSLGVITKVHINKKNNKVIGITIDMGFMKPDLFIGISYIKQFGVDAVFLKKIPPHKYHGLRVLSEGGELIGKVKKIVMDKSNIKEFEIAGKRLLDGKFSIKYSDIKEIGDHIILKKKHKRVKKEK